MINSTGGFAVPGLARDQDAEDRLIDCYDMGFSRDLFHAVSDASPEYRQWGVHPRKL